MLTLNFHSFFFSPSFPPVLDNCDRRSSPLRYSSPAAVFASWLQGRQTLEEINVFGKQLKT